MILPTIAVLFAAAVAALYFFLATRRDRRSLFRTAVYLGLTIGLIRAAGASFGWYIVEHTGGPAQVPGFALAMLAWPEAALFRGRRLTPTPLEFHVRLWLLLIASTTIVVALIAGVAARRRA